MYVQYNWANWISSNGDLKKSTYSVCGSDSTYRAAPNPNAWRPAQRRGRGVGRAPPLPTPLLRRQTSGSPSFLFAGTLLPNQPFPGPPPGPTMRRGCPGCRVGSLRWVAVLGSGHSVLPLGDVVHGVRMCRCSVGRTHLSRGAIYNNSVSCPTLATPGVSSSLNGPRRTSLVTNRLAQFNSESWRFIAI